MPLKKLQALLNTSNTITPSEPTSLTEVDGLVLIRNLFEGVTGDEAVYAHSANLDAVETQGYAFVELFVSDCILREYVGAIPPGRHKFELYYRVDLPAIGGYPDLRLALRALFLEDQKIRFEREWSRIFPVSSHLPSQIRKIIDEFDA